RARPSALDWVHSLSSLEGELKQCSKVKTHYYPSNARGCLWCRLEGNSGYDMFPDLAAAEQSIPPADTSGTEQAIRDILAFRFPTAVDLLPAVAVPHGLSNALREARNAKRGRALLGLLMMGAGAAGFVYAT